jgi:hypothetical protein
VRTSADWTIRPKLRQLGAAFLTDSVVIEWHGNAAGIRNLLTGAETREAFDSLVLATTNRPETELADTLRQADVAFTAIGDCVAVRHAPAAIYEGRKLALTL